MIKRTKKRKLKTHKAAAKRFYVTGTGKLMRRKGHVSHLRRKKPNSVKGLYDAKLPVSSADVPRLRRMMPYARS